MSRDYRSRAPAATDSRDHARYRAAFQHAAIGIALTTADGTFLDVNPALCAMLGYTPRDLMRLRLSDLVLRSSDLTGSRSDNEALAKLLSGEQDSHASDRAVSSPAGERSVG